MILLYLKLIYGIIKAKERYTLTSETKNIAIFSWNRRRFIMKKIIAVLTALMLVFALSACGLQLTDLNLPSALNEIVLEKGTSTTINFIEEFATEEYATEDVSVEQIAELLAKLEIAWTSSDTTVATVDNGTITAVGAGSASITASVEEQSLVIPVKVIVTPTDMKVTESIKLYINGTSGAKIDVDFSPIDSTETEVLFVSSDESVAKVDRMGVVTAVGAGSCNILVTSGALNKTVPIEVIVKATALNLKKVSGSIYVGGSTTLKPYFMPNDAEIEALNFTSSDDNVATVNSNGLVYGAGEGTAIVTVSSEGGLSATFTITVSVKPTYTSSSGVSGTTNTEPVGQVTTPTPSTPPSDNGSGGGNSADNPYQGWIPVDINNDGGCSGN